MELKTKTALFTILFVALAVIIIAVYDVYAITQGGTEATISHLVMEWSYRYPIFTFAAGFFPGVLAGHFFWRIRDGGTTKLLSDNSRETVESSGQGS